MTGLARRLAALAALLGLAAAAAGCGDDPPSTPTARETPTPSPVATAPPETPETPQAPSPLADLRALLDRRAAALQRGDPAALAATAGGPQRASDRRAARRAAALPLRDVQYDIERWTADGDRATLHVRSAYRLAGAPGRHAARRRIVAQRRRAGWRVLRERAGRERHPWELAPFAARRAGRFLVIAPDGIDPTTVGATLETARQAAAQRLEAARLRRRLLVVVAADAAQARALTGEIRGVDDLAAITDAEVRTRGRERRVSEVVAVRLVIPWSRFAALDIAERERVVAHELTHAALVRDTSGRTPAWLQEGVALYASRDRRVDSAAIALRAAAIPATAAARRLRRGVDLEQLSTPDAIARLSGGALPAAYAYSSAAAHYIAERYGERRLRRLYLSFNDPAIVGDPGPAVTDAALRTELGVSLRRFQRRLRRWTLTR